MTNGTSDKKGMPVWGWVLIGCGGLIVVGFLMFVGLGVFAFKKGADMAKEVAGVDSFDELSQAIEENPAKFSAEMMVRMNPELEIVESDDAAGTLTFRNTRTDEVVTLNYEDIAEGKFSVTTDEGEFSVEANEGGEGGVVFTGPEGETRMGGSASLEDAPDWVHLYPGAEETVGTFSTRTASGVGGMISIKTRDGVQAVLDHYEAWFEANDWTIGARSMTSSGDTTYGSLAAELADEGRTLNVGAVEDGSETQVSIQYNQTSP